MGIRVAVVDDDDVRRRGLIELLDERRTDDQSPGVAVVEAIRARRSPCQTRVIVRTGQFFDDAVRRRMREADADADYFFHRSELQDVAAIRDVVLPDRLRPGVPDEADPAGIQRLGVGRASRVNHAVSTAIDTGLMEAISERDLPSRALARRRRFDETARPYPMHSNGTVPDRNQSDPSLPQIAGFLQWATRAKSPSR